MALDWSTERYVRLYRPSVDHRALCWQARAIWPLLMQEADGAGVLGARKGVAAVAKAIDIPLDVVEAGIADLLDDGCLVQIPGGYCIRNYVAAQTATMASDSRKARQREVDRAIEALTSVADTKEQAGSQIGHAASREVTDGHDESRRVTPSRAEPSREEKTHTPRARDRVVELAERVHQAHAVEARKLADAIPGCSGVSVGGGTLAGPTLELVRAAVARWLMEAAERDVEREPYVEAQMSRLVEVRAAKARSVGHVRWWVPSTFWAAEGIERDLAQTARQAAASVRDGPGRPRPSPPPPARRQPIRDL